MILLIGEDTNLPIQCLSRYGIKRRELIVISHTDNKPLAFEDVDFQVLAIDRKRYQSRIEITIPEACDDLLSVSALRNDVAVRDELFVGVRHGLEYQIENERRERQA